MKKSFRCFVLACAGISVVLGAVNSSEAGIIPWAYDVIFGPVGSVRSRTGRFLAYRPFRARRYGALGYYPGTVCQPACNTGCSTGYGGLQQYQAGYYPVYGSYYGSYYGLSSCNNCYTGCSSCLQGCATGNCSSGTTPATGTTPTPATSTPTPTPTTTFKSTTPEIKPEATNSSNTGSGSNSNYDEKKNSSDLFSLPKRPSVEETKPEKKTDAPAFEGFGPPPVSKKTEAKKIPISPLLPVEQRKPAPTEIEENGGVKVPSLQLVPAPIEIDNGKVTFLKTPQRTRIVRTAHFHVPQVVRYAPSIDDSLIPPLPTPVHLAGK